MVYFVHSGLELGMVFRRIFFQYYQFQGVLPPLRAHSARLDCVEARVCVGISLKLSALLNHHSVPPTFQVIVPWK